MSGLSLTSFHPLQTVSGKVKSELDKMSYLCNSISHKERYGAMISSQWTRFPGRQFSRNIADGIRVTMGPDGVIYMNAAAWDAMGRPEAVEMMYDKPRRVIGLKNATAG